MQKQQLGRLEQAVSQSQLEIQADAMRRAQTDGDSAVGSGPDGGGEDNALQRFSLKLEDMAPSSLNQAGRLRASFGRSRQPKTETARAPLQKTYSQYNLTELSNAVVDETQHKVLHGVYGLLARHIEVPPHTLEELQPPMTLAEQLGTTHSLPPPKRRWRSIFGLPMLHPYARLAVAWRSAMLLFDLTFTAFWVPLGVGFCFKSYGDLAQSCTQTDLAGGIVYMINWLMGFQMGVVATSGHRRVVVLRGKFVAKLYVMYGKFVIDALAAVPFFVLIAAIASPHDGPVSPGRRLWSLLALLRLVRLIRLFNTVKVVYKDSFNGSYKMSWVAQRISVSLMFLLILGYQFLVVVNLCASLMVMLATYYGGPDGITWFDGMSWVNFEGIPSPLIWYHSAYWVITVLTTTGQGQAPRQLGEMIVSNFCSVYGMVFNGLVVGVLGDALMRASGDASALLRSRRNVARASKWAEMRHLRPSLVKDLQVFFADSELAHREADLARRDFNKEASYIDDLPTSLRRSVLQHIVAPLLEKVHVLSRVDPELRPLLASMFRPVDVPPNHDLCRQGTTADRLWVVEWGNVVALRHKEPEAHPTTGMTCLLGETVMLRGVMEAAANRPWTLRTTSVCRLWELHWADLEKLIRVDASLVTIMMQYVRERLIFKLDGVPERDYNWCELLAVLGRILKQPAMLDMARENLEALVQARPDDGSLPLLLSSWLEAGIVKSLDEGMGATLDRKRGLVTMSLQSNDTTGPGAGSNAYGAPFHYSLAAPSPAIISRYGTSRNASAGNGAPFSGGSGVAWGQFSGGGGPGSPLAILPAMSPAQLVRQPSSGSGGDAIDLASRSPAVSGELPPNWHVVGGSSESGGAGSGGADIGPTAGGSRKATRSRSFNDGAAGSGGAGGPAVDDADGALTAAHIHLAAPGLAGPSSGGGSDAAGAGGRTFSSLSRYAFRRPSRQVGRPPMSVGAAAALAPISSIGGHASGRVSISDGGIMAAARGDGGGDGVGGVTVGSGRNPRAMLAGRDGRSDVSARVTRRWGGDGASGSGRDGGRGDGGSDAGGSTDAGVSASGTQAELSRSVIAHTQLAYRVVDAGGVPSGSLPTATEAPAVAATTLDTKDALPGPLSAGHEPPPTLMTSVFAPLAAVPSRPGPISDASDAGPFTSGHGGGGGGGGGASPSLATARSGSPRLGSFGGGGTNSPRCSLLRTRSAHMQLPQVPEEDRHGGPYYSTENGHAGSGAARPQAAAVPEAAPPPVAAPSESPLAEGRTSAPAAAHRRRLGLTAGGGTGGGGSTGGFAAPSLSMSGGGIGGGQDGRSRQRLVPRSRSAISLGPSLGQPSVLTGGATSASPSLPRVREEGTTSGSGASASAIATAAASAAAERRRAVCPAPQELLTGDGVAVPGGAGAATPAATAAGAAGAASQHQQLEQQASGSSTATAATANSAPPVTAPSQPPLATAPVAVASCAGVLSPHISSVSPVPAPGLDGMGAASLVGAETTRVSVSERLPQLPLLPDRVSKLRFGAQPPSASLMAGRPVSMSNFDPASAAAAAVSAGAGGAAACPALTLCPTCGKCTCAECRARVLAAARAVAQGTAVVAAPPSPSARPPPAWCAAAAATATAATQQRGAAILRPSIEPARAAAGAAPTGEGAMYGSGAVTGPRAAGALWARGISGGAGAGGGRSAETWRRRRVSMMVDLNAPSMAQY